MEVTLAPDIQEMVQRQIDTGRYPTADDVLREAMRLLSQRDAERRCRLEELRAEIAIGLADIERGDVADLDIEAIIAEGRRRQLLSRRPPVA
jgi:antitoxin ParD1/3/4